MIDEFGAFCHATTTEDAFPKEGRFLLDAATVADNTVTGRKEGAHIGMWHGINNLDMMKKSTMNHDPGIGVNRKDEGELRMTDCQSFNYLEEGGNLVPVFSAMECDDNGGSQCRSQTIGFDRVNTCVSYNCDYSCEALLAEIRSGILGGTEGDGRDHINHTTISFFGPGMVIIVRAKAGL